MEFRLYRMKNLNNKGLNIKKISNSSAPIPILQLEGKLKKKTKTFVRSSKQTHTQMRNIPHEPIPQKRLTLNIYCNKTPLNVNKKLKTCFPFQNNKLLRFNLNEKYSQTFFISQKQNFYQTNTKNDQSDQLTLSMFRNTVDCQIQSYSQIFDVSKQCFKRNSSFHVNSSKYDSNQNPFAQFERIIAKKDEIKKNKSQSGLQSFAKTLLKKLNKQEKYDQKSNMIRKRYISFFHTRPRSNISRFIPSNRKSIQKSHIKVKQVDYQTGIKQDNVQNSSNYCGRLINYCKKVQNQQSIKKYISLFSSFSKSFSNRCLKKQKSISMIRDIQ